MKIIVNKKELLKTITYVIDGVGSDNDNLTVEDTIEFIIKIEKIVDKLPNNLSLGTISKVMEEALS